jgi:hypothetical protein
MPDKPTDTKAAERRLKRAEDAKRRRAMGTGLPLTDAALEEAATVNAIDIESAVQYWDRTVPPQARGLLDAQTEDVDA